MTGPLTRGGLVAILALRLTIDGGAVAAGNDNRLQRRLGKRAVHGDDLPGDC